MNRLAEKFSRVAAVLWLPLLVAGCTEQPALYTRMQYPPTCCGYSANAKTDAGEPVCTRMKPLNSCTCEPNLDVACIAPDTEKAQPPCTQPCCSKCGIDNIGTKICSCIGGVYAACSCVPPPDFGAYRSTGGACDPQGSSRSETDPARNPASPSLRMKPCTTPWTVCFTEDSTDTSVRGCVCMPDGLLHCGSVNSWFFQSAGKTTY